MTDPWQDIESAVHAALLTYSNVHRGSGHHSLVSTRLFEQGREVVLDYLRLDRKKYGVVFCTPRRAAALEARLPSGSYRCVSSEDIGLPLGIRALAVLRKALPKGHPAESGGGTARIVAPGWVLWANGTDRFEAGTPAIVNVIAFARALQMVQHHGQDAFRAVAPSSFPAGDGTDCDDLGGYAGAELLIRLRQTLIGRGARVPTTDGDRTYVNLDNGASTPTFQSVWETVRRCWRLPRQAYPAVIEQARSVCADVLGAPPTSYDVVFTSNTTEAINLVAESLGKQAGAEREPVVLNTLLEHNSNELPWRTNPGLSLVRLPVDPEGFVDVAELESVLRAYNHSGSHGRKRIVLVAVSGASNVLGTYNPIAEIGRVVHRYGAHLLVDAAQWIAHRKVDMEACGIDYLAFSGHKVYAPFGSGALLVRKGLLAFTPSEMGRIHASAEENVGGIAGLAKALDLLRRIGFDTIQEHEQALTKRALAGLAKLPRVKVYGIRDAQSPRFSQKGGVIVFGLKGIMPGRVARSLAERGGVAVRCGCHCAHLTIKRLLGVPPWAEQLQRLMLTVASTFTLPGLVRVSMGIQNTEADVDTLIETLDAIVRTPRSPRLGRRMDEFLEAAVQRVYGT